MREIHPFKVNNKDTRATSITSVVFTFNFILAFQLLSSNKLMSPGSTLLKHFARYVAAKISLYLANAGFELADLESRIVVHFKIFVDQFCLFFIIFAVQILLQYKSETKGF